MKILVIYDAYIPSEFFQKAFASIGRSNSVRFERLNDLNRKAPESQSEKSIREYSGSPDELASLLTDEDVLVVHSAPVTDRVLKASPNLKAVFCARGGPVNIDVNAATGLGIPVVSSPGRNAEAVADFTLALMLDIARNIFKGYTFLRENQQFTRDKYEGFFGHELGGMVLGLVGYGNVGSRVARRALSFGMSVLVFDPYVDKSRIESPGIAATDIGTLISSSDFISLHAREAPENVGMFGKDQFGKMKKSAYFINTARGSLVDEEALYSALATGQIAGAALDVMRVEPMDPKNPMFKLDNVIITPHLAGASHEVRFRGADIVGKQVERWISNQPLDGVLNPQVLKGKRGV